MSYLLPILNGNVLPLTLLTSYLTLSNVLPHTLPLASYLHNTTFFFLYPKLHYSSLRISYMLKSRTVLSYFTSPFHLAASRQMPLGLFCLRENDPLHLTLAFIPSSSIEEFYFCPTGINAFKVNIYHGYLLSARLQMLVKLKEPNSYNSPSSWKGLAWLPSSLRD